MLKAASPFFPQTRTIAPFSITKTTENYPETDNFFEQVSKIHITGLLSCMYGSIDCLDRCQALA
jgi:hypothetical protein